MKKLVVTIIALGALVCNVDARSIRDLIQNPSEVAPGIKRVDFSQKDLDSWDGLRELAHKYPNLEELNLEENYELGIVPREIGLLKKLKNLNLSLTNQSGFPTHIYQLANTLEVLNLDETPTGDPIPRNIARLSKLKELHLWGWYNTDVYHGEFTVPAEIGQLRNLEVLRLAFNNLASLPQEVRNLTRLRELDISSNQILNTQIERIKSLVPRAEVNAAMQFTTDSQQGVEPESELATFTLTPNLEGKELDQAKGEECPICFTKGADYKTSCGHYFHAPELEAWVRHSRKLTCPVCRQDILESTPSRSGSPQAHLKRRRVRRRRRA